MSWKGIGVLLCVMAFSACSTGIGSNAAKQLTLEIEKDKIQPTITLSSGPNLDVVIKNNTDTSQTIKIQGLKINFVSQPLSPQSTQNLHFQIDQNKGALNITSSDGHTTAKNISININ